ncbi:SRPBCC domain-containing protein [Echinicola strongylocentroti]|uniref:SRPBCC domain-containing protein n=1 Tax=Echinicola strongylocentroti TaxID=1795355 RepID=A0A2Z4IK87_9BACT|nr:SRPBCC domain-containing protein [Echinicola strongylocentroti]AWW31100.1 SRPBCC domain-containing protein [Echinicola strongylocentroti]
MDEQSFATSILVDESPEVVFNAINDPRGWWSLQIEGATDQLGGEFFYHYKDVHLSKMKVVEHVANKKIVWLVTENSFNFVEDKTEWVGSKIIFEIEQKDRLTQLKFTHAGLVPAFECYKVCEEAWTNYIENSLYKYITEGKGDPNLKDDEGYNAELAEKWKLDE